MANIYLTPLMRAVWHDMLVDDLRAWRAEEARADAAGEKPVGVRLPAIAPAIAIQIGRHFDDNTGETFVGQDTIARELNVSERIVWQAIAGFAARGSLVVRRRGPRSNFYGIPIERVASRCESYVQKSRNRVRNNEAKESHRGADQYGNDPQKQGERVAPACGLSLTSPSEKISSRVGARAKGAPSGEGKRAFEVSQAARVVLHPGTPEFDRAAEYFLERGAGKMHSAMLAAKRQGQPIEVQLPQSRHGAA